MIDPITLAESTWHIELRKVGRNEWIGPCPLACNYQGHDRFHVFTDGNPRYWCRVCNGQGFMDKIDGRTPTAQELLEARVKRLEERQRENEWRLSALERMAHCQDHIIYHNFLTAEHLAWWDNEGINHDSVLDYKLGFCPHCPTDSNHGPSYTIPVINGDVLQNIRHRLMQPNDGGKYRPHMAGLGNQLFNADFLTGNPEEIVVVEGEKKGIVLAQNGIANVAITGQRSFKREWLDWFRGIRTVYVALDPDAAESAHRLAAMFDGRGRVVSLPVKPDEFFYLYGGDADDFGGYLRCARPA